MTKSELRQLVLALPVEEKLELVEEVWGSLTPAQIPVPRWQLELIDARLEELDEHPEPGESWQHVEGQVWPGIPPK